MTYIESRQAIIGKMEEVLMLLWFFTLKVHDERSEELRELIRSVNGIIERFKTITDVYR